MKRLILFVLVLISVQMFSQSIPGYNTRVVREKVIAFAIDSGLHIPRYCGTPSGVRTGVYVADGAIAMDTCNNLLYIYSGGAWTSISGTNIYNSNGILSGNRTLTGLNNTYSLNLDSLNSFRVQRNGTTRLLMNSTVTELASPNSTATVSVNNSNALISYSSNAFRAMADSFTATKKIVYETNINGSLTTPNSLVTRSLVDSLLTTVGGTPTLQQVIDVNGTYNNGSITVDGFNGGYIRFTQSSDPLNMEGGDDLLKINRASDAFGTEFDFSLQTALRRLKLPDVSDTLADRSWVRALGLGGGGVTAADLPLRITGSTVSADTSVAYSPSLTTNQRTQKILDSLQAAGWGNQSVNSDYRYYVDMSNSTFANMYFSSTGTASQTICPTVSPYDGWFWGRKFETGTTTTGRAWGIPSLGLYTPIAISTTYRYSCGARIRVEDLSDGTETYSLQFGFMDDVNTYAAVVDGIGFRYTHADSSGNFIAWAQSNNSITEVDTGVPVVADQSYDLQLTGIGGSFYFYVDGVLKATISTNIPLGTARETSLGISIIKSAGTTSRTMYAEWIGYDFRKQ